MPSKRAICNRNKSHQSWWDYFFAVKFVFLDLFLYICHSQLRLRHKIASYWIGKLFKSYEIPRQAFFSNGGPRLYGMLSTVDYKGGGALKTCRSEFHRIIRRNLFFCSAVCCHAFHHFENASLNLYNLVVLYIISHFKRACQPLSGQKRDFSSVQRLFFGGKSSPWGKDRKLVYCLLL